MDVGIKIGSDQHRDLFCRMLLDSFDPYRPAVIDWPELAPDTKARLVGLPFWDVAIETEENAAYRMQSLADGTEDPLMREALALNAFEERRHREVLGHMVRSYGIALGAPPTPPQPLEPRWGFLRTGYGECFDSFFAFGLFALARRSGFFPEPLLGVFEPIVQEEARHNLFFTNWVAYMRARHGGLGRVGFDARRIAAMTLQAWRRIAGARRMDGDNFTRTGSAAIGVAIGPREFLALCLEENERRFAPYDARLLRPRAMAATARILAALFRGSRSARRGAGA
jgi:hypothetical protein